MLCVLFLVPSVGGARSKVYVPQEEIVRVKFGQVLAINEESSLLLVLVGTSSAVYAYYSSTTEVYLGTGEATTFDSVKVTQPVYMFTISKSTTSVPHIQKIVIPNKSKLLRKKQDEKETSAELSTSTSMKSLLQGGTKIFSQLSNYTQ